jgi:hypothetical protein
VAVSFALGDTTQGGQAGRMFTNRRPMTNPVVKRAFPNCLKCGKPATNHGKLILQESEAKQEERTMPEDIFLCDGCWDTWGPVKVLYASFKPSWM